MQSTDSRVVLVASQIFRPDSLAFDRRSAWPLTRRASDDARRPLPAKERGEVKKAPLFNFRFKFQTATPSRSRGAMRPRFAKSLANLSEGMERWEAPECLRGTLEAGLTYPPRAARHRARPRLGAAPPSAPPATRPSTVPGRPGPASSRSVERRIASRKRPLVGQDASRISEVLGMGIGIHSQVRE